MALLLPIYFLGNTYVVHFRVPGMRPLRAADPRIAKLRAIKLMGTARMAIKGDNPVAGRNLLSRKQKNPGALAFFKLEDIKQMYDCYGLRAFAATEPAFRFYGPRSVPIRP